MNNYTSKVLRAAFILTIAINSSSCTNSAPESNKEVKQGFNPSDPAKSNRRKDEKFLNDACLIIRKGVRLGQLAQEKSNIPEVKDLGRMMEEKHTESLIKLKALAKNKHITLPKSPSDVDEDAYQILTRKSGIGFGNEYSTMMVSEHKNAITIFKNAYAKSADPEIRTWAKNTLPVLRKHLKHSLNCQETCAKM